MLARRNCSEFVDQVKIRFAKNAGKNVSFDNKKLTSEMIC